MIIDTFLNRELWWLEGNRPYLEDARDPAASLLERLKSLAVISANLDDFFIGRIPALKQLIRKADQTAATPNDLPTALTIRAVAKRVRELTGAQQRCFVHEIQPLLARDGMLLLQPTEMSGPQRSFLDEYFHRTVFPLLTPLAVRPGHPFPLLGHLGLYLLISIRPSTPSALPNSDLSIVPIPSQALPRFIALPDPHGRRVFMLLEDIIRLHLPTICNGYDIVSSHAIRVTRAAPRLALVRLGDAITGIQERSRTGPRNSAVRLQLDADVPADLLLLLRNELGLWEDDVYAGASFVALSDLLHLHAALDVPPLPKPPPHRRPTPARPSAIGTLRTLTTAAGRRPAD